MQAWEKLARDLPPGRSARSSCPTCGDRKKNASITNHGKTWTLFCHKCKQTQVAHPPPMTAAERLEIRRRAETFEQQEPQIPDDFTTEIPIAGLLWLSKGGLHINDIRKHGFGWSEDLRRVIMPVMDSRGRLTAVQARKVDETLPGPKYLGQVWSGDRPVWASTWEKRGPGEVGGVVLTEDILSAARVGKVHRAWALLGTNLMPAVINRIASAGFETVHVWMDDDTAGHKARKDMLRQLGAVGINARAILSDRDPKHHTLDEMKGLIHESQDYTW